SALINYCIDPVSLELLIVRVKVLHRRNHAFALNSLDVSHSHATREIRIFAVAFEISAPERSAVNVHRWSQNHVASNGLHFLADRLPFGSDQFRIPGGGHGHSCG